MAIQTNNEKLERYHRELVSIDGQLAHYVQRLKAGTACGVLHHSVYANQVLPWLHSLKIHLADAVLSAQFTAVYPYWTLARLTSLQQSLTTIAAVLEPHHAVHLVDGCWNLQACRTMQLSAADCAAVAAAIQGEMQS